MKISLFLLFIISYQCFGQTELSTIKDSSKVELTQKMILKSLTRTTFCEDSSYNQGDCEMITYMVKYDRKGNRIETHHYHKDSSENTLNYLNYNDQGNVLTELSCVGDTLEGNLIQYHYDSLGRLSHKDHIGKDSVNNHLKYTVYFEYNLDTLLVKSYNANQNGIYGISDYFYDQFNNLCLKKSYTVHNSDTILTDKDSTIFNKMNKAVRSYQWKSVDGYFKFTELSYDSLGRNVEFIIFSGDGEYYFHHSEYEYNENSQVIRRKTDAKTYENYYSVDGKLIKQTVMIGGEKCFEHEYHYTSYE